MTHSNRKIVSVTVVLIATFAVLAWARGDRYGFDIRTILPFCSGKPMALYDFASLAMLGVAGWGICRLRRQSGDGQEQGDDDLPASDTHDANKPDDDDGDT